MQLSVLDVLPTGADVSPSDALGQATSLARHVDALGYKRLWFAEHHGMDMIASSVPELMIAHVAPVTRQIRVGAGGVMLPNHSPLRVVEQYRTLHALHPGRIDLGIGRAAGTDPLTSRALATTQDNFAEKLSDMLSFANGDFPKSHPYHKIKVTPQGIPLPPLWMLGSSGGSASIAGQIGTGYAFAGHFSPVPAKPAVALYKDTFSPSAHFPTPQVILALSVICAEESAMARAYSTILACSMQEMLTGFPAPIPTLQEALDMKWSETQLRLALGPIGQQMIYGNPEEVKARIDACADDAQADEVMVMTIIHEPAARHHSYQLLADAYGLPSTEEDGFNVRAGTRPPPTHASPHFP